MIFPFILLNMEINVLIAVIIMKIHFYKLHVRLHVHGYSRAEKYMRKIKVGEAEMGFWRSKLVVTDLASQRPKMPPK